MDERLAYLGFSVFPGIGPVKFGKLLSRFGTAHIAWNSSIRDLQEELGKVLTAKFDTFRKEFSIRQYQEKLYKSKVSFLTLLDADYPKLLKQTTKPPFVLYVKGDPSSLSSSAPSIAVVGTRRVTQYGRDVTELFTQELVAHGFTIVSGLAMGVDGVAHKTVLEAKGTTIAVLGCGVDCCTPEENRDIYNSILKEGGCIVSELPLGHSPTKGSFPARNRIIAGLSQAVVVTEGAEDSGSLITADYAFTFGRPVFAVPGPITSSLSKGPYKLIQKGAKLVTSAQDIISGLGISNKQKATRDKKKFVRGYSKQERKIIELLENEPLHFDEIVKRTKLQSAKVGTLLSMMEIKGMVKSLSTGSFSIAN